MCSVANPCSSTLACDWQVTIWRVDIVVLVIKGLLVNSNTSVILWYCDLPRVNARHPVDWDGMPAEQNGKSDGSWMSVLLHDCIRDVLSSSICANILLYREDSDEFRWHSSRSATPGCPQRTCSISSAVAANIAASLATASAPAPTLPYPQIEAHWHPVAWR